MKNKLLLTGALTALSLIGINSIKNINALWVLDNILFKILWLIIFLIIVFNIGIRLTSFFSETIRTIIKNKFEPITNKFELTTNKLKPLTDNLDSLLLLRVPIITGTLFFLIPIIANIFAPTFLKNLYTMSDDAQTFVVMASLVLTSIFIVSLSKTILALYFNESSSDKHKLFAGLRLLFSVLIVIPSWLSIYINTYNNNELRNNFFFFAILAVSSLFFAIAIIYELRNDIIPLNQNSGLDNFLSKNKTEFRRKTFYAIQASLGFIFYIIIIYSYYPGHQPLPFLPEAPALLYLSLIFWIITYIFGGISLLFDKSFKSKNTESIQDISEKKFFRFPIITSLIIFLIFSYSVWKVDHFFELIPSSTAPITNYQEEFKTALKNRLSTQASNDKTLVLVSSSGGGIQASGWTTQVLAGLQEDSELGESFANSIGLISSVSGASVGSMFYLDQFDVGNKAPSLNSLDQIRKNSTDDWLDAIGWGLAYPDFMRTIGIPIVVNKYVDRGYTLEKDWQKNLKSATTLDKWHTKILAGEMPIPVFNSTLLENGRRFLISPMKFVKGELSDYVDSKAKPIDVSTQSESDINKKSENDIDKSKALDFKTLYENACKNGSDNNLTCDLNVTTAARLSASFPYVTPMSRNDRENSISNPSDPNKQILFNYHMADGGYFDNFGQFTVIEWLDDILKLHRKDLNIKKVLLIQINAFPEPLFEEEKGANGLDVVLFKPLTVLNSVRDSTQQARNDREFSLLKERWKSDVIIKKVNISFPRKDQDEDKEYTPPLSWRLTKAEKEKLKNHWNFKSVQAAVKEIKEFWKSTPTTT